jgi:hypothetical protein
VRTLLDSFEGRAKVWPFQTGWRALSEADLSELDALIVEIDPALVDAKPDAGEVADLAQVRALCRHFAKLDDGGKLGAAFGPLTAHSLEDLTKVETEEGWILGV